MNIFKSEECMTGSLPFSISKGAHASGHEVTIHKHEFIELVYVASGKSTHYIDSFKYEVSQGDIIFVNYNQTHSFFCDTDIEYYNLFIKPEYISEKLADAETIYDVFSFFIIGNYFDESRIHQPLTHLNLKQRSEMDNFVREMLEEVEKRDDGYELALDGYMRLIFSRIIRSLRNSEPQKLFSVITSTVLEYIDANYTKNITLSELASECFYNSAYLGRLFKTKFNMSIKDYITEKRVEYAKKLLLSTDETVETIAFLAGFSDKKQFYRIFKDKEGCTPGEYRQTK